MFSFRQILSNSITNENAIDIHASLALKTQHSCIQNIDASVLYIIILHKLGAVLINL